MPFKLRLKKSRQYNVVSKNLFVITVELLDHSLVECTLSADNTGQECLYNVCQRVGLHQPEFFGLRFVYKHHGLRWVEMAKPLKKQLEKFANESRLYLAVMFYISDVGYLNDEITRYQYFLQLKKDINEGQLSCTSEQAVLLTSYYLQAEFGNHDLEKHTAEYLSDFVLFPKHLTVDPQKLEDLMSNVLVAHSKLQGLLPAAAEIRYIQEAQQLDGYGFEYFSARDDLGRELLLGISVNGIVAKSLHTRITIFYKWEDISRLSHHRKYLYIDSTRAANRNTTYQLEDTETAKYIKKLCEQQSKFYKRIKTLESLGHDSDEVEHLVWKSKSLPNLQNSVNHNSVFDPANTNSFLHGHEAHTVSDLQALAVHPEIQYEDLTSYPVSPAYSGNLGHGSAYSIDRLSHQSGAFTANDQPLSSSNLSLHVFNRTQSQNYENRRALLPSYRPAPDYETAVQQKYGSLQHPEITVQEVLSLPATSHSYESALNAYNRMEHVGPVSSFPTSQVVLPQSDVKSYTHYKNFDDLAHLDEGMDPSTTFGLLHNGGGLVANGLIGNVFQQTPVHRQPHQLTDWNTGAIPPVSPSHTYSTPELTSQGLSGNMTCEQLINQFKPPPPYPYVQRPSASTPDLASKSSSDQNGPVVSSNPNILGTGSPNILSGGDLKRVDGEAVQVSDILANPSDATHKKDNCRPTDTAPQRGNLSDSVVLHQAVNSDVINKVLLALRDDTIAAITINNDPAQRSRSSSTQSAPEVMKTVANTRQRIHSNENNELSFHMAALPRKKPHQHTGPGNKMLVSKVELNGVARCLGGSDGSQGDKEVAKSKDSRCQAFESRLLEGSVFMEFEHVPKKLASADYATALLAENAARNRFKDVLPYENNRVRLTPSKDNKTGYINASHITVTIGKQQRLYIAAQGPLKSTVVSFWQMVWEQNAQIIIMLTEVKEQGREKCFPYWPQGENGVKLEFGEYQVTRKFSSVSVSFVTCALTLTNVAQKKHRNIWHIQYTAWPDHGCPGDVHGFLAFMEEIDSVRRHAASELPPGKNRNVPAVVHCSAGVGRSGVTILCDTMIYCLDHNESMEVPTILTHLRQQRMLTVQTLAQYKFVYSVLIQYLKNSRLI